MKRASVGTLLMPCFFIALTLFGSVSLRAEDVPQPIDLGTKEVSVYIAVPNLNTLLDNIEAVGKQFEAKQQPGMIKLMLGMQIGDPALANLDATKPIVAMLFKTPATDTPSGPPPFAIFIPAKAAAPYDAAFTRAQMVSAFADGVLVVAQNADALTKGQAQLAAYKKISDAKIKGDLRIYVGAANLMESYGPLIQKGMDMGMQQMAMAAASAPANGMDPKSLLKILGVEMKVLAEMLNELDSTQLDIAIKPDQIAVENLVCAKKDSPLGSLFSAPPPGINKTLALLTKSGSLSGGGRVNPAGYKACVAKVIDIVTKDPAFADAGGKDLQDLVSSLSDCIGGDFAISFDMLPTGGISMETVMSVSDEKKMLTFVENMVKLMGSAGTIGKMYADMGMGVTATLQKSVRQHAGADVHRMKIDFDTTKMPPAQAAQFKNMPREADLAIVKGMYLVSYDPAVLDKLIDKATATGEAKPDVSLESITAFGDGKQMYFDLDMIGLVQHSLASIPGNPAAAMLAQLKTKAPMLLAASRTDGRLFQQIRIPLAPFIELSTLAKKNGGAAPPPPRGGADEPKPGEKF